MVFPLILLGVLLIFGIVFFVIVKRQEKATSINDKNKTTANNNSNSKNSKESKESKDHKNEIKKEDVFEFMEFDKILNNMIVQENGKKFTMAIKCKGINYDLMSDIEQISVEEGFITFLNTLRYPIQLYVQAQNIDLKGAIRTYKENVTGIRNELDRVTQEYTRIVDEFDATEEELSKTEMERSKVLNVYEYASDIISYVERLSLNKSLLQRNFYVLVSYYSSEIISLDNFNKDEIVEICYNELLTRAHGIMSGLGTCSVTGKVLDSNEVADLLYTAYNRDDKGLVSVRDAIESGFYRLYSTSEEAFIKKQELQFEVIQNEAQIKAIEAIKKAINDGTYIPPEVQELAMQEQISRTASDMIKNEDIPQEIKDTAKKILIDDYKVTKTNILSQIKKEIGVGSKEKKSENMAVDKVNIQPDNTQTVETNNNKPTFESVEKEKSENITNENINEVETPKVIDSNVEQNNTKVINNVDELILENTDEGIISEEKDNNFQAVPQFETKLDLEFEDDRLGSNSSDTSEDDEIIK